MKLDPSIKSIYYKVLVSTWAKVEAISGGDDTMKEAGSLYLPRLGGQTDTEYQAYLARGCFFNAFARTINGLSGAILRKEVIIKTNKRVDEMLPTVTLANESIQETIKIVIDNVLEYGYFGILVDMPVLQEGQLVTEDNPYFAMYPASTIINFRTEQSGSETKLTMLCLAETAYEENPENPFELVKRDLIRVLVLEDSKLIVRLYKRDMNNDKEVWSQHGDDIMPKIKGASLDFIPFVFFGAVTNNPIPTSPPLIDLANLNIKHWQVSTDYYHGLHYCALPTPWAAGFDIGANLYIGAQKAWVSDNPQAQCGYLEFTGQGLQAIEHALDRLEAQMAIMGARMLEEQKKAAEAAETVVMRYSGDTATLSSIVTSVEQGMIKAIDLLGTWVGIEAGTELHLNRDFVSQKLSAQDITALLQAYQGNAISLDTFLYNLQVGEVLPADRTIEDEKMKIEMNAPFGESEVNVEK